MSDSILFTEKREKNTGDTKTKKKKITTKECPSTLQAVKSTELQLLVIQNVHKAYRSTYLNRCRPRRNEKRKTPHQRHY